MSATEVSRLTPQLERLALSSVTPTDTPPYSAASSRSDTVNSSRGTLQGRIIQQLPGWHGLINPYPQLLAESLHDFPKELLQLTGSYLDLEISVAELFLRCLVIPFMRHEETQEVDGMRIWGKQETRETAMIWGKQVEILNLSYVTDIWHLRYCSNDFADRLAAKAILTFFPQVTTIIAPCSSRQFITVRENKGEEQDFDPPDNIKQIRWAMFAPDPSVRVRQSPYACCHNPANRAKIEATASHPALSFEFHFSNPTAHMLLSEDSVQITRVDNHNLMNNTTHNPPYLIPLQWRNLQFLAMQVSTKIALKQLNSRLKSSESCTVTELEKPEEWPDPNFVADKDTPSKPPTPPSRYTSEPAHNSQVVQTAATASQTDGCCSVQ